MKILLYYLIFINLAALILMGVDKKKAKKHRWRIKERTLFLPVILGGALGGTVGMLLFRHKTKHWYFAVGFPLLLVIQIWLLVRFGVIPL